LKGSSPWKIIEGEEEGGKLVQMVKREIRMKNGIELGKRMKDIEKWASCKLT